VRAAERGEDRPSGAQGARCLTSQPCGAAAAEPRERRVRCEASGRDGLPLAVVRDILSQRTLIQRSRPVILKVRHAVLAAQRHGDRRRWGEMYQLARVGCLAFGAFILFVILISLIVPLLALLALAGVVYLFVLLWRSSLSLRTKRAITGMIVYPAGLYFLWRYTRHDQNVKLGALAVTVGATALLSAAPAALFGLVPLMGAGFLFLFLTGSEATTPLPAPAMPVAEVPAGRTGKVEVPRPDRRRLLEIESANTATERRVLQVREFSRLASAALAALPDDPK